MCSKEDYIKAIEYLKSSPMFNLSLSSKELFHSNFLYWIYITNKGVFKELMKELGASTNDWGQDEDWEVKREYLNFDLSIVSNNQKKEKLFLVIENKVKSIPTAYQLEKYNDKIEKKKHKDVKKILLSLTKPCENCKKVNGWEWKDYNTIADFLIDNKEKFVDYKRDIVKDYAKFVKSLCCVAEYWKDKGSDYKRAKFLMDFSIKEQGQVGDSDDQKVSDTSEPNDKLYKEAIDLRIHDLYGKYRTSLLKQKLLVMLSDKIKKGTMVNDAIKCVNLTIKPQDAYSNSQPILEVMITGIGEHGNKSENIEPEAFFIQIQRNQYRHAINARCSGVGGKDKKLNESIERIKDETNWHWFINPKLKANDDSNICFNHVNILDKSSQRKEVCSFAGYGGVNFIYQYKNIKEEATIQEVLEAIVADVENIIKNYNNLHN